MGLPAPLDGVNDDEADMLALVLGDTMPVPPTPVTLDGGMLSGRELGERDEQDDALEALRRRSQQGKPEPLKEIAETGESMQGADVAGDGSGPVGVGGGDERSRVSAGAGSGAAG